MKRQLQIIATSAAATTALLLAALWPMSLNATANPAGPAAVIATPVFKVNGCELSLRPTKADYAPGETPQVEVRMVNPSAAPATFEAVVTMTAQEPGSEMSRRGPVSQQVWIESIPVSLAAGETKLATLDTHTKLQAGYRMRFVLKCKDQAIVAGGFKVPAAPGAAAAPAEEE
ncbi:MAG: hypothetical protein NTV86_09785 [Planctomycetota bacterium]|nr:hypothetical protein [Planctomycetota bacterium]